jgi:hypothetical protein
MKQTCYLLIRNYNENETFPVLFAVLSNKTEELYNLFFDQLLNYSASLAEVKIIISVDFEKGLINAVKKKFKNSVPIGNYKLLKKKKKAIHFIFFKILQKK